MSRIGTWERTEGFKNIDYFVEIQCRSRQVSIIKKIETSSLLRLPCFLMLKWFFSFIILLMENSLRWLLPYRLRIFFCNFFTSEMQKPYCGCLCTLFCRQKSVYVLLCLCFCVCAVMFMFLCLCCYVTFLYLCCYVLFLYLFCFVVFLYLCCYVIFLCLFFTPITVKNVYVFLMCPLFCPYGLTMRDGGLS
jgi:hypothetical protein